MAIEAAAGPQTTPCCVVCGGSSPPPRSGHFVHDANLVRGERKQDKKRAGVDGDPGPCSGLRWRPGGYSALQEVAYRIYESGLLLIHDHVSSLLDRD